MAISDSQPILAVETRPSEQLEPAIGKAPAIHQVALRDRVLDAVTRRSGGNRVIPEYERLVPHSVHPSEGSFEGVIAPNYLIEVASGDMDDARMLAALEGTLNAQDAVAILRPKWDLGEDGVQSYAVRGGDLSPEGIAKVYALLNQPGEKAIEFTKLPGEEGLAFGNFDELPLMEFSERVHRAEELGYNLIEFRNDGDYLSRNDFGSKKAQFGGYSEGQRSIRDSRSRAGRPDLSPESIDSLVRARLGAYSEWGAEHGYDTRSLSRRVRSASKRWSISSRERGPGGQQPLPNYGGAADGLGFYSALERAILSKFQGPVKSTPERVVSGRSLPGRAILDKAGQPVLDESGQPRMLPARQEPDKIIPAQPVHSIIRAALEGSGVTEAELASTGFMQWLEGKDVVTPDEMLDYLASAAQDITEYTLVEGGVAEDIYDSLYDSHTEGLRQDAMDALDRLNATEGDYMVVSRNRHDGVRIGKVYTWDELGLVPPIDEDSSSLATGRFIVRETTIAFWLQSAAR